jgi:hypothetical protein
MKEGADFLQNYANVMNTLCEQNAEVHLKSVGGAYKNGCALKG